MPSFTVEHETNLNADETFQKVCDYFEHSEGLKKMDADITTKFDKSSKTGRVKGSKFECDLKVSGGGKTKVTMNISIPLMLSPFKGTIEKTLREKMTKILG